MKNNKSESNRIIERILKHFVDDETRHTVLEDLEERYEIAVKEKGKFNGGIIYSIQLFIVLGTFFIESLIWSFIMFKNYLKVAMRYLLKHKGFSFINISGLAIGMACSILILLWVQNEMSYDRFHENADNIYLVAGKYEGRDSHDIWMPGPLTLFLKDEYPEIVNATSYKQMQIKLETVEKSFLSSGSFVDPSFFDIFSFSFVQGDPKTVFTNPFSIVITEDIAGKFFGDDNPIGKTIGYSIFGTPADLTVTGVIKNVPQNSHIQFDFLLPYELGFDSMKTWNNKSLQTYVLLHGNSTYREVIPFSNCNLTNNYNYIACNNHL